MISRREFLAAALPAVALVMAGCGKRSTDQALDTDANGYICLSCESKFYTARDTFASFCPKCKKHEIEQVLGFVCQADQVTTIGARNRGARGCRKCGKATTLVSIPREEDLKTWGAQKVSGPECGG